MKNVLGLILKKEEVIIDGKKIDVFSYLTSMGTPKKIKSIKLTINDVDEEVSDIRNIGKDNANYYYVRAKTKEVVNDNLIIACNNRYKNSCFMMVDGQVEEIKDSKLLDKINTYISNNNLNNIYNSITSKVIGQDEHVKSIFNSILWNNYLIDSGIKDKEIVKNKHNILIMGKSGVGKTEIISQIADFLNLPIVTENAPSYSLLDGDGSLIDKMLLDLIYITDGDMELAKRGILVIENFDKLLSSKEDYGKLTSNYVQKELFRLIDGDIRKYKYDEELISFNTHGLSIVLIGDFDLSDKNTMGFNEKEDDDNINSKLLKLGFQKELIDRINKIRKLNNLNKENLITVLKSRDGKLMNYLYYLKSKGIDIKLNTNFLEKIATQAIRDGSGVRSLNKIIDDLVDNNCNDLVINNPKIKRR